jgi:CBS domain-containing protein
MTVLEAATIMANSNIGALPVLSGSILVGIVTDRDLLLGCVSLGRAPSEVLVGEVMTPAPITIAPDQTIEEAARKLGFNGFRRLPVVEGGELVGVLTADDIARYADSETTASMVREIASQDYAALYT